MKPTYEEFKKLVKEKFTECMPNLTEAEIEEYINGDEAEEVIKDEYNVSSMRLEKGEITESVFRTGGAGAAASCLYILY